MPTEVEAKFRASGPSPLDRLADAERIGPARLGPLTEVDEVDRYLDTDDGRLAAARWACRLRRREGGHRLSLKGPPEAGHPAEAAMHLRPELEGPATDRAEPRSWPASPARDALDRLAGGRPLREVLRLVQRRGERPVSVDGRRVATLSLDRVEMLAGDRRLGRLHVVELEAAMPGAPIAEVVAALAGIEGLEPEPTTKLEHALAAARRAARE